MEKLINGLNTNIESLSKLMTGDFTKEIGELFFQQNGGLFPTSQEIEFKCSCPDHAIMCNHVAAVLYGAGSKLDINPQLFFELRGIDISKFIQQVLGQNIDELLSKPNNKSDRIMDFDSDLFGI